MVGAGPKLDWYEPALKSRLGAFNVPRAGPYCVKIRSLIAPGPGLECSPVIVQEETSAIPRKVIAPSE
jgi:hypothetical protein